MTPEEIKAKRNELLEAAVQGRMEAEEVTRAMAELDAQQEKEIVTASEQKAKMDSIMDRNVGILRKVGTELLADSDGKVDDRRLQIFRDGATGVLGNMGREDITKFNAIVGGDPETFESWVRKDFAGSFGLAASESKESAKAPDASKAKALATQAKQGAEDIDQSGISNSQGLESDVADGEQSASKEEVEAFERITNFPHNYEPNDYADDLATLAPMMTRAEREHNVEDHTFPEVAEQLPA